MELVALLRLGPRAAPAPPVGGALARKAMISKLLHRMRIALLLWVQRQLAREGAVPGVPPHCLRQCVPAQAESERRARQCSAFMARMAHELRTPLNGILGYAQLLQADPALGERQRSGIGVIRASGEQLLELVNDILDHGRLEAGTLRLEPVPLALGPFLQALADAAALRAEAKGLIFALELGPGVADSVQADEQRLRQVLDKLLANALGYTERGQVWLRVTAAGAALRFEVGDSGAGIAPVGLERIFSPFEYDGAPLGVGLGLAICWRLVRMMGGELDIVSTPGAGTTVAFALALAPLPGAATLSPDALQGPPTLASEAQPPQADMQALYRLARRGNMQDIVRWADQIEALDPACAPFAGRLRRLARDFQSKAIVQLVKHHLERSAQL